MQKSQTSNCCAIPGYDVQFNTWNSMDTAPEKGKRVLIKSRDGEVNVGYRDSSLENINVYLLLQFEINGHPFKFNILDPIQWKEIPY